MSLEKMRRDAEIAAGNGTATGAALAETIDSFRRWLFLPDPAPLLAVLGTVAANLLDGDPVWLLLVGPPGSGKSELLGAVASLPNVHPTATLTEAALLSGTPKKEHDKNAKGGLLRSIGDFGIVLCKDFGSVLSMNRDARAAALAALREVYDGSWTRHVGTGGGLTLTWKGKVGLVAGCTPTIDRHYAVMGAMGERFVLFRLPETDTAEQARRALAHARHGTKMRAELAGGYLNLHDWRRDEWTPAVKAAGLEHRPPYALRHTYATFSIAAGVSLFALARRMGTSVQQIDKTYGHLLPDAVEYERGLLDAFDAQKPSDVGVGTR